MPAEPPKPPDGTGLLIRREAGLVALPNGASPALEEIINRSLVHIQTSKALVVAERRPGEEWEFEIVHGVKMVMCWIPPGEFLMGSPVDETGGWYDEAQHRMHRVRITQGFWLAKTQTTQAQWQAVMGDNPSFFRGDDLPVDSMSWEGIVGDESGDEGFLGELNKLVPKGGRFHLPTEAQWEYACRAGTTGPYSGNLDEMGWYSHNSGRETHPVGLKKPNAWGLHDMHGNVTEWCSDSWGWDCDVSEVTDPTGPADSGNYVYRGGSWDADANHCRSSFRCASNWGSSPIDMGFRLARSSDS